MYKAEIFNQAKRPEEDQFFKRYKGMEVRYLSGKCRQEEMFEYLKQALEDYPGKKELIESKISLFKAMEVHGKTNRLFDNFNADLVKSKEKGQPTKPIERVGREEYLKKFRSHKDYKEIISGENNAIDLYRQALANWQADAGMDNKEVELMVLDLLYRQAERIDDPNERNRVLDLFESDYKILIDNINVQGKKAEVQAIYLLNKWARDKGLDHVYRFEHGLPIDDRRHGQDIKMVIGGNTVYIDIKSHSKDKNSEDFNKEKQEEAFEKRKMTDTIVLPLVSEDIRDAYGDGSAGSPVKSEKLVKSFLDIALGKERKDSGKSRSMEKKEFYNKYRNIPSLQLFGFIPKDKKFSSNEEEDAFQVLERARAKLRLALDDPARYAELKAIIENHENEKERAA